MSSQITLLLEAHRKGDATALDAIAGLLYPELKAMAARRARDAAGVGATTLVHETFLRLLSGGALTPADRREFFALAATVMRRIIVDEIRYVSAGKRDGREVTFAETVIGDDAHDKAQFLLQVDEMLGILAGRDERLARVFECRYFAGLTTSETAEAAGVSERTAERLWSSARAEIARLMEENSR